MITGVFQSEYFYLRHESQHPEKVPWRTKGHCVLCFKRKKEKNPKPNSWSAMLYEKDLHLRGNVKLIKGNISKLESGVQERGASHVPLTHIQIPTEKDMSCIFGRKWPHYRQQEEEKNSPAWQHQSMRWLSQLSQYKISQYKITMLWTPSFSNWHFVYNRPPNFPPSPLLKSFLSVALLDGSLICHGMFQTGIFCCSQINLFCWQK